MCVTVGSSWTSWRDGSTRPNGSSRTTGSHWALHSRRTCKSCFCPFFLALTPSPSIVSAFSQFSVISCKSELKDYSDHLFSLEWNLHSNCGSALYIPPSLSTSCWILDTLFLMYQHKSDFSSIPFCCQPQSLFLPLPCIGFPVG